MFSTRGIAGRLVRLAALIFGVLAGGAFWGGCTLRQYSRQADVSAYRTVAGGQKAVLGQSEPFDVAYQPVSSPMPQSATQPDSQPADPQPIVFGDKVFSTAGELVTLTLPDCLEIAFCTSRPLQNRKELLYAQALLLANARRGWDVPLLGGSLAGDASFERVGKGGETKGASSGSGPSLTQRFAQGGVLTLAAAADWATDFLGGSGSNLASSLLDINLAQPLLRGAWNYIAYEGQYRLERDFLIAVWDYQRFRELFAAEVFQGYYSVLQQRDSLENEWANIQRLLETVKLTRVQVQARQASQVDLDEAEQNLLNAQTSLASREESYANALDAFKISLGLPVAVRVELDYPQGLEELVTAGVEPMIVREDEAVEVALATRPDVLVERADYRDAERDVELAADRFLPQLDVELDLSASGQPPSQFYQVQFDRGVGFAGVTLDYDLDQTDTRDDYRLALIAELRARRDLDEFLDTVRLSVRSRYRELTRAQRSYELQARSLAIARRRRRLAVLQQKEGQIAPRDVLRAEEDLLDAQNAMTSALVSYSTTRLRFLAELGLIHVDQRGRLHEREKPILFERLAERYAYLAK